MKTIGVGVIGLGMGRGMLAVNDDPDAQMQVRAICDQNESLLAQVQAQHSIPFATADYAALLARPDIDVVGIYTPDDLHIQHLKAAAQAGKHIICTKPMVVSREEAQQVVDLVRQHQIKFMVGQTSRFVPRFKAAKKLYDDGDLGRPLFAEAHYVHDIRPVLDRTPWRHERPQDFLYGGACHPVDLLSWFFGDVDEVFVYATQSEMDARYPHYDNFLINLRFKSGVMARVLAVFGLVEPPLPMLSLGIYGSGGTIIDERLVLDKLEGQPTLNLTFDREQGHGREVWRYMRHFETCLLEDRSPLINEVVGAKVIATISACWESVHSGLPVKVDNNF